MPRSLYTLHCTTPFPPKFATSVAPHLTHYYLYRAMAIGNKLRKFGEVWTCSSWCMQTRKHAHHMLQKNHVMIYVRKNKSQHTGRIGFQTSWSWKLVLSWRTDLDKLCRHRIAATCTLGTRSDKPLTTCPIKLFVSITWNKQHKRSTQTYTCNITQLLNACESCYWLVGWLVGWRLTALLHKKGDIVPLRLHHTIRKIYKFKLINMNQWI